MIPSDLKHKCPLCGDYWERATMFYPGSCCACEAEAVEEALDGFYDEAIDRAIDELTSDDGDESDD